jgi:hypothetical protein
MTSKITKLEIANLTASYLEDKTVAEIIMYCNLEPKRERSYFEFKPNSSWVDSYGCQIYLKKNKKEVLFTNINLINNYDIYAGLNLDQLLKITDKICIVKGIDEDFNKEFVYYNCLCVDKKIRSYLVYNEKIYKTSPLYLGYEALYEFIKNKNIIHWYSKESNIFIPCLNQKIYYSCYPLPKDLLEVF